jgi:sarcosine oxidase subunit gamma
MPEASARSRLAASIGNAGAHNGMAFTDLTLARRAGVKGPGAPGWLKENGYGPLPRPNRAVRHSSGLIVAMLGETEALLLDRPGTTDLWSFGTGAAFASGVYPVPRAEGTFWIAISGERVADMFASVCGVDLRSKSFSDLSVAQTIVARSSAIIVRDGELGNPTFHVVGDISLGSYLVRQLLNAAAILDL